MALRSDNPDPKVSVVIPTYNRESFIGTAIESVLKQTLNDIEIIVVDDASQDGTVALVRAMGDRRIRLIPRSFRGGGATARNDGIDAARGDYIAFLDSDDEWLPNKLAKQVALADREQEPNHVYFTKVLARAAATETIVPKRAYAPVRNLGDYFFLNWGDGFIQTSSILLSRHLAQKVKFTDGLQIHQDWDFCLRLENHGAEFILVDEPLVIWNVDPRTDRIGEKAGRMRRESLQWIESVRHLITTKAYLSFKAHLAVDQSSHVQWNQLRFLCDAFVRGALGPRETVRLMLSAIHLR